ncbi:D-erythronate dehydrogenase [Arenibaculum pallidiluteum]|uniref:D-erythronate dehydrogenase n=1 Tax=Arenibaculum pallidiluteum TaxID=2812559 RepID=UPI001A97CF3A|nr:D-erythronate dehydrogenase [Arenibaculum pallidiluteum]
MRILIIGAAGMIGARLAEAIASAGTVAGRPVAAMLLADRAAPAVPGSLSGGLAAETLAADVADPAAARQLAAWRPDVVFHLAAVVSGEAEADFSKGYRVNVDATWALLEAFRLSGTAPRLVFASSLAVYGPPFPDVVPDDFALLPQSSYGAQKAIGEFLLSDFTRKGFVDGIGIRLPTIVVRPGAPNAAASGFLSGIIREPLRGVEAPLPVPRDVAAWIASPRIAVETLLHAAGLQSERIGSRRCLTGRGVSVTVGEMIEALSEVAGPAVAARIRPTEDPVVARIVRSWPRAFETAQARELGFPVDEGIRAIIEAHIAHEMGGRFVP